MYVSIAKFCLLVTLVTPFTSAYGGVILSSKHLDCNKLIASVGEAAGMNQTVTYDSLLRLEQILSAQLKELRKSDPHLIIDKDDTTVANTLKFVVRAELNTERSNIDWESLGVIKTLRDERFLQALSFITEFIDKNIVAIVENSKFSKFKSVVASSCTGAFAGALVNPDPLMVSIGALAGSLMGQFLCVRPELSYNHKIGEPVRDQFLIEMHPKRSEGLSLVVPE